jgi:phage tail-like protein
MDPVTDSQSGYLDYLPAIFRQDPFAGRFLLAFEEVLSGSGAGGTAGLENVIATLARYFDPATADREFLPWLSGWVSLTLRADWDEATQRDFIAKIVPLYRLRGTSAGMQQMLELYTGKEVEVFDSFDALPYFFAVRLTLSVADPGLLQVKQEIARAIIDQEKPAHTYYALQVAVPTMRLVSRALHDRTDWPRLTLGQNTLLGTTIPNP